MDLRDLKDCLDLGTLRAYYWTRGPQRPTGPQGPHGTYFFALSIKETLEVIFMDNLCHGMSGLSLTFLQDLKAGQKCQSHQRMSERCMVAEAMTQGTILPPTHQFKSSSWLYIATHM